MDEYTAAYDIFCAHREKPWSFQTFQATVNNHRHFIALCDQKIVGFCIYSVVFDTAELLDIGVSEQWKGRGIGHYLLSECIKDCLQTTQHMLLEVAADNTAAIALYRAMGFTKIAQRNGYYIRNNQRVDADVMELLFPK